MRIGPIFSVAFMLLIAHVQAQPDSVVFDNLLIQALQGNIPPVLQGMDLLNDASLSPAQATKKHALLARFRGSQEIVAPTTDPAINELLPIYQRYWRAVMLDTSTRMVQDSMLIEAVVGHIARHCSALDDPRPTSIKRNWNERLEGLLNAHHCFAAVGKTGPYYDLLLHLKETGTHYSVTTPEDTLEVKVVFMDSVISNGWEGFATMDTYYPGGWATNDALYCAHDSYDLTSENFTVSYLKHEGKHFADYKRFPELQSADLEYRAKLVELCYADSSMYDLLDFFQRNSAYDPGNGHAYANFCIVRNLSRSLFHKQREEDIGAWKKLLVTVVHAEARALLLKNTKDLQAAGALTVRTFLK